jgi:hypothetical protein
MSLYLRLLDAVDADAETDEMCRTLLNRDPASDPEARRTLQSHLERARWISEQGFKDLLKSSQ